MIDARDALLSWYDSKARTLPWRVHPPRRANPYHVWLSEVMLQQTTVATVIPYFLRFIERWPSLEAFAAAGLDELRVAWQGLGYYRRIENLHKGVQYVVAHHGGALPQDEESLLKIPGVGLYTAAAIASIAFARPTLPIDGNIKRVMARFSALEGVGAELARQVQKPLHAFIHPTRSGDVAQALMDLGATVCTPKNPECGQCPIQASCRGYQNGNATDYPKALPKKAKPDQYGVAFVVRDHRGHIWLQKRPEQGLLSGLIGTPGTPWRPERWSQLDWQEHQPVHAQWQLLEKPVVHVFTHFRLFLDIYCAHVSDVLEEAVHPRDFHHHALPTLYKKVLKAALDAF
ncbi:MAG: A/G-specific adenine glycosylase [Holosporales bacterium]